jgi:dethiobiotin synthetase
MRPLPRQIFVTGIDTNIGKTVTAAILAEAIGADYWKPVQSGDLDMSDSMKVDALLTPGNRVIHPEAYALQTPAVPVYSAEREGIVISPQAIKMPETSNRLIIEGAGGLMVHLGKSYMIIDLIQQLGVPVVIVSKNYLGSINHTLLTIEALRSRGVDIAGIIYNGPNEPHMRELIAEQSGVAEIGSVEQASVVDQAFVSAQAKKMKASLEAHFIV